MNNETKQSNKNLLTHPFYLQELAYHELLVQSPHLIQEMRPTPQR